MFRSIFRKTRTINDLEKALKGLSWDSVRAKGTANMTLDRQGLWTVQSRRKLSPAEIALFVSRVTSDQVRRRLLINFEKELWEAVDEREENMAVFQ